MNNQDLESRCLSELKAFQETHHHLNLKISIQTVFSIIAQLQLASRHPGNRGPASELAFDFARLMESQLAQAGPATAAIMAMGWDPFYDLPSHKLQKGDSDDRRK